jgi:hypothetical protein
MLSISKSDNPFCDFVGFFAHLLLMYRTYRMSLLDDTISKLSLRLYLWTAQLLPNVSEQTQLND